MIIADIIVGARSRQDLGDLADLAASMDAVGQLQPVVVDDDGNLVAGQRRIEAAKSLGWVDIEAVVVAGLDDAALHLQAERDENTCRKDFTPSEMVVHGRRYEELERPKAEATKKAGKRPSGKLPQGRAPQTTEKVAKAVGTSRKTYEKAKAVVEAAEDEQQPEPVRAAAKQAKAEMDRTGKVDPAHRKVQAAKLAEAESKIERVVRDQLPGAGQEIDRARLRADWSKALHEASAINAFDPEAIAAVLGEAEIALASVTAKQISEFIDKVRAARSKPLRLVGDST